MLKSLIPSSESFTWNADPVTSDPNTNAVGYNVYIGTASGHYTITTNASNLNHLVVSNLVSGQKYFAIVKAYNLAGVESNPSNEVSFIAAAPISTITIGAAVVYTTVDSGKAGLISAQKANLTQSAKLKSISFYVSKAAGTLQLAIYGGVNNPTTLIASTPVFNAVAGWNTQQITTTVLLPGSYWLAFEPSSNDLAFEVTETAGTSFYASSSTVPNTFPNATYVKRQWSFYATLIPVTAPPTYNAWITLLNTEITTGVNPAQLTDWLSAHPPTSD